MIFNNGKLQLLLALVSIVYGMYLYSQGQDTHFIATKGIVNVAKVTMHYPTHRQPVKTGHFSFSYEFSGKKYNSDRYTHGQKNKIYAAEHHDVGDIISVYVNPYSPDYAVVKKNALTLSYALMMVGFFVLINAVSIIRVSTYVQNKQVLPNGLKMFKRVSAFLVLVSIVVSVIMHILFL